VRLNDSFGISECEAAISGRGNCGATVDSMNADPHHAEHTRRAGLAADIGRTLIAVLVLALLASLDRLH
jgi:hypothetical protein